MMDDVFDEFIESIAEGFYESFDPAAQLQFRFNNPFSYNLFTQNFSQAKGVENMEITIKGRKINRIKTLHLSEHGGNGEPVREDSYLIYDNDTEKNQVMYFDTEDIEEINI